MWMSGGFLPMRGATTPSSPGEFRPEALTDFRTGTSRFIRLVPPLEGCRLPPESASSSGCPLTLMDPDAGDLLPSLLGRYPQFNAITEQSAPSWRFSTFGLVGPPTAESYGAGKTQRFPHTVNCL
jgi:hypothetical protein